MQRLIARASTPPKKGEVHGRTNVARWLFVLVVDVLKTLPKDDTYDGNMRAAAILSQVLAYWYLRTHRAKCYDPHRPVESRQRAFGAWLDWCAGMSAMMLDERQDAQLFDQPWDFPFGPDAKDGTYV